MKVPVIYRRFVLIASTAAIAGTAEVSAQPGEIRGSIDYEGAALIPAGTLEIRIDDPSSPHGQQGREAAMSLDSDGGARTLDFTVTSPLIAEASPAARIVAELKRADGWLLSRGSAKLTDHTPVRITLYTAMYQP
ncbi:hypothetical protein LAZ29_01195 [Cereibacter sphaeroides]|uniref:hypothetical protein n=1 Tax=Cereibacter sphaeroides TaxID=1063 RepID=UPI001F2FB982|nr:hypothetical protein [Cereibacter sphaeroides]MCE6949556.1 hypothetical protein [Cereibacter sphaeroides]